MEISKMLTISTAHITEKTADLLEIELDNDNMQLCVYNRADFGWFIHIPDDCEDCDIPQDLLTLIKFAKDIECDWLCLDCDGEVLEYLDSYEW